MARHVESHDNVIYDDWKSAMINAGFKDVEIHQVAGKENFPGTLVMLGRASHQ